MTAPTGKPRGRPRGARNRRTVERVQAMEKIAEELNATIPNCFEGDAVAYLQGVYKDPREETRIRIDAAHKAAPFERPRLSSIESTVTHKHDVDDYSDDEIRELLRAAGLGPGSEALSKGRPH